MSKSRFSHTADELKIFEILLTETYLSVRSDGSGITDVISKSDSDSLSETIGFGNCFLHGVHNFFI